MSDIITINSEHLIEFCRLLTNQNALFLLDILLQEKDNKGVYIPKTVIKEITQIKDSSLRRILKRFEKLGFPLKIDYVDKIIIDNNTENKNLFDLLDNPPHQVSKKDHKSETYELLHLSTFDVSIGIGHFQYAVDRSINLPNLDLGSLMLETIENDDGSVNYKLDPNIKFLSRLKYKEFVIFLHSLYSCGIFDFDKVEIKTDEPINIDDLTRLRVRVQNKPLLGSGSLILSELANTKLFDVSYQTGNKSKFKLLYGGIHIQIQPTIFQKNKYKTELIDGKLIVQGQL